MFLQLVTDWIMRLGLSVTELFLIVLIVVPLIYYVIMYPILLIFGEKYTYKRFQYDKVALFWPLHHLAPAFLLLIVTLLAESNMESHFIEMNYGYTSLLVLH